jgi:hypothetical protein
MERKSPQPSAFMWPYFSHKKSVQYSFDQYAVIIPHNLHAGQEIIVFVLSII